LSSICMPFISFELLFLYSFWIERGTCFIIDGAASGVTKWRHFSSVDVAPWKRRVIFLPWFIQNKILSVDFSYERPMIYRELCVWCMTV
jgi:hypothetical protein